MLGNFLTTLLCHYLAYIYPLYKSVQLIVKGETSNLQQITRDEYIQWVMFWTVNGCFVVLEYAVIQFVASDDSSSFIFPSTYLILKAGFYIYLVFPFDRILKNNGEFHRGASQLYLHFLQPSFLKYETLIDEKLELVKQHASEKMNLVVKSTTDMAVETTSGLLVKSQQYLIAQALGSPPSSSSSASNLFESVTKSGFYQAASDLISEKDAEPKVVSPIYSVANFLWQSALPANTEELDEEAMSRREVLKMRQESRKNVVQEAEMMDISDDENAMIVDDVDGIWNEEALVADKKEEKVQTEPKKKAYGITSPSKLFSMAYSSAKQSADTFMHDYGAPLRRSARLQEKVERKAETAKATITKEDNEILLTQFKVLMVRGIQVHKYGHQSGPKVRTLRIDPNCNRLLWEPSTKNMPQQERKLMQRYVYLHTIISIDSGNNSPGFTRTGKIDSSIPPRKRCISLTCQSANITTVLDFEATSMDNRNLLLAGFGLLVDAQKRKCTLRLANCCHSLTQFQLRHHFQILTQN